LRKFEIGDTVVIDYVESADNPTLYVGAKGKINVTAGGQLYAAFTYNFHPNSRIYLNNERTNTNIEHLLTIKHFMSTLFLEDV